MLVPRRSDGVEASVTAVAWVRSVQSGAYDRILAFSARTGLIGKGRKASKPVERIKFAANRSAELNGVVSP